MTKSAALDGAPYKIRVNAICPGCKSVFQVERLLGERRMTLYSYVDAHDITTLDKG